MIRTYLKKAALLASGGKLTYSGAFIEYKNRFIYFSSSGLPYLDIEWERGVPEEFEGFVEGYSARVYFENPTNSRVIGKYGLGSTCATLDYADNRRKYVADLDSTNFSEMRELYELIRAGKIWPLPDRNYQEGQVPKPLRHFRELINEMWQLVRRDVRNRLHRIKERVVS